jgi:hypothetical protein
MTDGHLEGSSAENQAHHGTEEGPTKGGQRSYISCIGHSDMYRLLTGAVIM